MLVPLVDRVDFDARSNPESASLVASEASLSGTAAAPTVADVDRVATLTDPVVRNLQITQSYGELSRAFAALTGGGPANWCTFATWASKQAGQTIRKADLTRTFERLFGLSSRATAWATLPLPRWRN